MTLTIQQSPTPIVKKQTIEIINPDETKTVVFRDFPRSTSASAGSCASTSSRCRARRTPATTRPNTRSSSRSALMSLELAVAIAAAAAAAIALGACAWLWLRVERLRAAQRVLLGGGRSDLVEFAVSLQGRIDDLHRAVDEIAAGLSRVDRRVDGSLTNTAVDPLRRLRGQRRPAVGVVRVPRLEPHGHGGDRHPGPRLRAPLREGARAGQGADRALSRGAGGGRAAGALAQQSASRKTALRWYLRSSCNRFSS